MKKRTIKNNDICIPHRLFVHNLFLCSGYDIQNLCELLDDTIKEDIEKEINLVKFNLSQKSLEDNCSLLPDSFKRYVEETITKIEEGYNRLPHYCLLMCYNKIKGVANSIEAKSDQLKPDNEGVIEDLNIIKDFESCIQYFKSNLGAGAASERQLKRILELSGGLYNNKEQKLVMYLIKKVIPRTYNLATEPFLMSIKNRDWNDIVYKDVETMQQKIYLREDSQIVNETENFFNKQFDDLFNFDASEFDEVGNILLNIYKKLDMLYTTNNLSSQQSKEIPQFKSTTNNYNSKNNNDFLHISNAVLSSHILNFMKWLPMISEDEFNIEFMNSIDNVIEKIRNQALVNKHKNFSYESPVTCSNNSLFISNDNIDLRKILIDALHSEFCIHSQFHKYYGITIPQKEGTINE